MSWSSLCRFGLCKPWEFHYVTFEARPVSFETCVFRFHGQDGGSNQGGAIISSVS